MNQRKLLPPAPSPRAVSVLLTDALAPDAKTAFSGLKSAAEFYQLVKADKSGTAFETGAWRDAQEWLRDAALEAAKYL